jgi:preprotein translocase subunit SecG
MYNNLSFWIVITLILVFMDYGLILFLKNKKPSSKNNYFKLNEKYGFYKMLIPRMICIFSSFFNLFSKDKLDQAHRKTIVIIYFFLICTLCYDALNSKSEN